MTILELGQLLTDWLILRRRCVGSPPVRHSCVAIFIFRTFCDQVGSLGQRLRAVTGQMFRYKSNKPLLFIQLHQVRPLFELHVSQSMPGPLTCFDAPFQKSRGTEGAALGPLTSSHCHIGHGCRPTNRLWMDIDWNSLARRLTDSQHGRPSPVSPAY